MNPPRTIRHLMTATACSLAVQALAQQAAAPPPAAASAPQAAAAGDADAAQVIVTAQRRAERVQTVPIAISVVSGQQLERQQVTELRDLSRATAGIEFGANSGNSPGGGASVRGLGTIAFGRAAEAAVGVVVDGVVQGNANVNNLFDVARVEVLRGPQGTLFGQSVSAGVINIATTAPKFGVFQGRASTELSRDGSLGSGFGRQVLRVAANLPLGETTAARVSLIGAETQGVTRNVFTGVDDKQKEWGVRARLLSELTNAVTVNLIADINSRRGDGSFFVFGGSAAGSRAAQFNATCGVTPSLSNFSHCADYPSYLNIVSEGLSGQVDWAINDDLTLTSITAYRRQAFNLSNDIDRLPEGLTTLNISSVSETTVKQFTQELRLASNPEKPLSYTAGLYYQDSDTRYFLPGVSGNNIYRQRAGLPAPALLQTRTKADYITELQNLSAFGELRYAFGANTVFSGLRYNQNTIDATATTQALLPAPRPVNNGGDSREDKAVTWRIGATHNLSRSAMLYGTVSKGFKSGQIGIESVPIRNIRPEKPLDLQLGLKSDLLGGRLGVNLTAFHTAVKDYQATVTTLDSVTGVVTNLALNIDKVVSKGVEVEVFGRVARNITLNASFLYNHAVYPVGFRAQNGGLIEGQQLSGAPRTKLNLAGEYFMPVGGGLEGFVGADVSFKGRTRYGIERDDSEYNFYKAHTIVGARVGVRAGSKWSVALFARNIGDVPSPFSIGLIPQPLGDAPFSSRHVYQNANGKRQVGLQASADF